MRSHPKLESLSRAIAEERSAARAAQLARQQTDQLLAEARAMVGPNATARAVLRGLGQVATPDSLVRTRDTLRKRLARRDADRRPRFRRRDPGVAPTPDSGCSAEVTNMEPNNVIRRKTRIEEIEETLVPHSPLAGLPDLDEDIEDEEDEEDEGGE